MARSNSLFIRPDPFSADPLSDSFLPSKGLFSPSSSSSSAASSSSSSTSSPSSSRPTPNYCSTIPEEEDDDADELDFESDSDTITSRSRLASSIAIHPRILRADSTSDDDASDFPPVLRFPLPPRSSPSPPRRQTSLPLPPQPELKSCFEDYDDDDYVSPLTPTSPLVASRPAPQPPTNPLALLKRATNSFLSRSPPKSKAEKEKPLPRLPAIQPSYFETYYPKSGTSPTPSLGSSSSSSSLDSTPYIPVGSIVPAPTVVEDFDEYLETLEMYFPSSMWNDDPHHQQAPALAKRSSRQYASPVHSRTSSAESAISYSSASLRSSSSSADLKTRPRTSSSASPRRPSSPREVATPTKSSSAVVVPKSILKSSKSTPHLRNRSVSASVVVPAMPSSSRRSLEQRAAQRVL